MRVRNVNSRKDDRIELQMTPMIDIVFQLLVFFIMTFKIVAMEGDFNIKMPLSAPREGLPDPTELPPFRVRLVANSDGSLRNLQLDQKPFGSKDNAFATLNAEIIALLGDDRAPGSRADTAEVELDCDYNLDYQYVIKAITAVSGYTKEGDDEDEIIKLVEKIKFAPPRGEPGE